METEIGDFQKLMTSDFNYTPSTFRAPFLAYSEATWSELSKHKLIAVNASVMTKDWKQSSKAANIAERATSKIEPGAIVLMHEKEETLKALPQIISTYKQAGYSFVTVAELLKR